MTDNVKVCKKHGDLLPENIKETLERGKIILRCKPCTNENARLRAIKYRKDNHQKLLAYKREYREKQRLLNPPKGRIYKKRNPYDPNTKEIVRNCKIHGILYKEQCFFKIRNGLIIQSQCRECAIIRSLKRYELKKESIIKKNKEYRLREKQKIDERAKIYREKNKKLLSERLAERRKKDPDKFKKIAKIHRQKNADKIRIRNRKYVTENKLKVKERSKKYIIKMKDHLNEKRRIWKSKITKELTNGYVKDLLSKQGFGKTKNIPSELIDLKRISIKINRLKKDNTKCRI
jgi:hypothetical protein